jgi:hypothetical protein
MTHPMPARRFHPMEKFLEALIMIEPMILSMKIGTKVRKKQVLYLDLTFASDIRVAAIALLRRHGSELLGAVVFSSLCSWRECRRLSSAKKAELEKRPREE